MTGMHWAIKVTLWGGIVITAFVIAWDIYLYATGRPTISNLMKDYYLAHPWIGLFIMALVMHQLWPWEYGGHTTLRLILAAVPLVLLIVVGELLRNTSAWFFSEALRAFHREHPWVVLLAGALDGRYLWVH